MRATKFEGNAPCSCVQLAHSRFRYISKTYQELGNGSSSSEEKKAAQTAQTPLRKDYGFGNTCDCQRRRITSDCHCGQRQPTILMLAGPSYTYSVNLGGAWFL